jgi:hypothetical protein
MPENDQHIDPPRYPKLITPIEDEMKLSFTIIVKKVLIDVTKQLTKEVKSK